MSFIDQLDSQYSVVKFILYHVTRFEPMTAAHFGQPYNKFIYVLMSWLRSRHSPFRSESLHS